MTSHAVPGDAANKKVVSACVFFDEDLLRSNPSVKDKKDMSRKADVYAAGVYALAIAVRVLLPGWSFWLYINPTARGVKIGDLENIPWCRIIQTHPDLPLCHMPLERFRPLFDPTVATVLVVDTDNVLTRDIVEEVKLWMSSGKMWLVNYPAQVEGQVALPRAGYLAASPARPCAAIEACFNNKLVSPEWPRDELWVKEMFEFTGALDVDVFKSQILMNRKNVPAPSVKGYQKRCMTQLRTLYRLWAAAEGRKVLTPGTHTHTHTHTHTLEKKI